MLIFKNLFVVFLEINILEVSLLFIKIVGMKVEIWSDIMCPFCYIGKRHFEKALANFEHKDDVIVEWKSFQLNPELQSSATKTVTDYLMEAKGWTAQQAKQANAQVTAMAEQAGLKYNLEKAVLANTLDAHRLIQLAKSKGKGDIMEELLFKAYFTDAENIADPVVLEKLGIQAGLSQQEVTTVVTTRQYEENVHQDIYESRQIGVRGVPYFVLNDKYAISGAQPAETFAGALQKAWEEWGK